MSQRRSILPRRNLLPQTPKAADDQSLDLSRGLLRVPSCLEVMVDRTCVDVRLIAVTAEWSRYRRLAAHTEVASRTTLRVSTAGFPARYGGASSQGVGSCGSYKHFICVIVRRRIEASFGLYKLSSLVSSA